MGESETSGLAVAAGIGGGALALVILLIASPMLFLFSLFADTEITEEPPALICAVSIAWPVPEYGSNSITSYFGRRASPGGIGSADHEGIDIGAPEGTPICAAGDGCVSAAGYSLDMGYYVEIDHGGNIRTMYGHMSKIVAQYGEEVTQGEVIGLVGSTGVSTGNHLHFALSFNDTFYDPLQIVSPPFFA